MKYGMVYSMIGSALNGMVKPAVDAPARKKIKEEYKQIILRADDIGAGNKLISSYVLAAYFIAMNRCTSLTPQQNFDALEAGMRKSKLMKLLMGDSKNYFSEKNMESRRAWSKDTYQHKYKNDWVVDVVEGAGQDFVFGLDYKECGVCKLCRDENCFELAKYLCRLDFMLVELIGIHLERTQTLADGGDFCDFRFYAK